MLPEESAEMIWYGRKECRHGFLFAKFKKEGRTAFATGGYIRRFQTGEGGSVLFLSAGGESRKGPYTFKEISNWYATGQLSPEAFLWKEGMAEWVRVGEFISGYQEESSFWVGVFGMLSSLTGLSPIERFSLKSIFKGVFRHRTAQERIDFLRQAGRNLPQRWKKYLRIGLRHGSSPAFSRFPC